MAEAFRSLGAPDEDELTLLELADRLLNRGVVLSGEATISVAGVDLIYLGLNVVLTAVENLAAHQRGGDDAPREGAAQSDAAAARDHGG
jgi:gas vesicle structural protein